MLIPKHYSLAEANQLVPFLEDSFAEIRRQVLRVQQGRLELLAATAEQEAGAEPDSELEPDLALELEAEADLESGAELELEPDSELAQAVTEAEAAIHEEIHTLLRMGVLVPSVLPPEAHVLSHRGASPVILSWQPGEPAFLHWHSLDWGFAERAPIDQPELFGDPVLPS